jgi:hypothetical protein
VPKVDIPESLYARLEGFKPLLEVVIEEEVSLDTCIEMVLEHALDVMLIEVIGSAEPHVLLMSMQQLAAKHPEVVYRFVADAFEAGAEIERQKARQRIGFAPPD